MYIKSLQIVCQTKIWTKQVSCKVKSEKDLLPSAAWLTDFAFNSFYLYFLYAYAFIRKRLSIFICKQISTHKHLYASTPLQAHSTFLCLPARANLSSFLNIIYFEGRTPHASRQTFLNEVWWRCVSRKQINNVSVSLVEGEDSSKFTTLNCRRNESHTRNCVVLVGNQAVWPQSLLRKN